MSLRRSPWGLDRAEHWSTRAVCRDMDPDLFVVLSVHPAAPLSEDNVAAVWACRRCPVQAQCLREAQRSRPRSMVQGGWVWSGNGEGRPANAPAPVACGPLPRERSAAAVQAARMRLTRRVSWPAAARACGVSITLARNAEYVLCNRPDLVDRILSGELSTTGAYEIARGAT